jgi:hypothetical protein
MTRGYEQPTLFELTTRDVLETLGGLPPEKTAANVQAESDPPVPAGSVSAPEGQGQVFRPVSPLASISLHDVCATCGREITGSVFVILDYEELGAFCNQDCADERFRSYPSALARNDPPLLTRSDPPTFPLSPR